MKKILELFSGNGDITKALQEKGFNCISVDYDPKTNANYHYDVYTLTKDFYKQFDFIWLSPDCTTYSLASHGIHRKKGGIPVSDYAKQCDVNNEKLINLLLELNIPFIVENPRGHLRNKDFMKKLYRITVYYSTYGSEYTKPTDLFSNNINTLQYFNTIKTLGKKHLDYCTKYNVLNRSKIPSKLIDDICLSIIMTIEKE